jgi:hypothetical protein
MDINNHQKKGRGYCALDVLTAINVIRAIGILGFEACRVITENLCYLGAL